jgi:hypothetical protein
VPDLEDLSSPRVLISPDGSPIYDFRNYVPKPASTTNIDLEALQKRVHRKMKRDTKRAEKRMRKMKLKKEITALEESGIKVDATDREKLRWKSTLKRLSNINVFSIGVPITLAQVERKGQKVRVTHGEKKRMKVEKETTEEQRRREELNMLPVPPPPKHSAEKAQQLELKLKPEDLFQLLPVDVNPMRWQEEKNEKGIERENLIFEWSDEDD